jgi:aspartyl protease family protein
MAIGFMRCAALVRCIYCKWRGVVVLALLATAQPAGAAEIGLIGVFPGRGAVLVIDASPPQSVRIGQKFGGVTLVSVDKSSAVIEEAGRRRTLMLGQHVTTAQSPGRSTQQVTLTADGRGQFITDSIINGASMRVLVDTGATLVAIPGNEARRLGLDFTKGRRALTQTANGTTPGYHIKLDSMKVGEIELQNVDAMVLDGGGLTQPLLGMSFLNRLEMRREGDSMTLKRRF